MQGKPDEHHLSAQAQVDPARIAAYAHAGGYLPLWYRVYVACESRCWGLRLRGRSIDWLAGPLQPIFRGPIRLFGGCHALPTDHHAPQGFVGTNFDLFANPSYLQRATKRSIGNGTELVMPGMYHIKPGPCVLVVPTSTRIGPPRSSPWDDIVCRHLEHTLARFMIMSCASISTGPPLRNSFIISFATFPCWC